MDNKKDKKYKIKVMKDKSDNLTVDKERIFSLPLRVLLIAKTGQGKSNIIGNFFRSDFYGNDYSGDDIFLISPMINDHKLETLCEFKEIPDDNVITEYDEDIINAIYDSCCEEFSEREAAGKKPHNKILIFDDVSWSGNLRKGKFNVINRIFCNGRKHNISCILTSQFYSHILPSCRANCSGVILGDMSEKQLKIVSEENNYLDTEKEFKQLFRKTVSNKHDYFIINYSNSKDKLYMDKDFNPLFPNTP